MIVATAGHIDHGKTSLVKALTGTDADRLPEEKARGLTIDLGFAYWQAGPGQTVGFIDVPGHERFIKNMLAGVTGIDAALLIVAADDGPMPQTREHLAILDLLGVQCGIVAVTKADRAEPERVQAVAEEAQALAADTGLAGAPVLPVSAITGEGVPELRRALQRLAGAVGRRRASGRFRLAVDRSFTLRGAGLVVTGTAFSGAVKVGDRLLASPGGIEARVRAIHAGNVEAHAAQAGQRVALNLAGAGLRRRAVSRGDWLLAPEAHGPTRRIDIRLRVLGSEARAAPRPHARARSSGRGGCHRTGGGAGRAVHRAGRSRLGAIAAGPRDRRAGGRRRRAARPVGDAHRGRRARRRPVSAGARPGAAGAAGGTRSARRGRPVRRAGRGGAVRVRLRPVRARPQSERCGAGGVAAAAGRGVCGSGGRRCRALADAFGRLRAGGGRLDGGASRQPRPRPRRASPPARPGAAARHRRGGAGRAGGSGQARAVRRLRPPAGPPRGARP